MIAAQNKTYKPALNLNQQDEIKDEACLCFV